MTTPETAVREMPLDEPAPLPACRQTEPEGCCGARKPLGHACHEHQCEPTAVRADAANGSPAAAHAAADWTALPLADLCHTIVAVHHAYVRNELPRLGYLAQHVVERHAADQPDLPEIQKAIGDLGEELLQHLSKEERVLFPHIAGLDKSLASGAPRTSACFGTVQVPIGVMLEEHDSALALLTRMRALSNNFTPPVGACPAVRSFFQGLAAFEADLRQHIHLENDILFPRALALEQRPAC